MLTVPARRPGPYRGVRRLPQALRCSRRWVQGAHRARGGNKQPFVHAASPEHSIQYQDEVLQRGGPERWEQHGRQEDTVSV